MKQSGQWLRSFSLAKGTCATASQPTEAACKMSGSSKNLTERSDAGKGSEAAGRSRAGASGAAAPHPPALGSANNKPSASGEASTCEGGGGDAAGTKVDGIAGAVAGGGPFDTPNSARAGLGATTKGSSDCVTAVLAEDLMS